MAATPKPKKNTVEKIAKIAKKVIVDPTSVLPKSSKPTPKPKKKELKGEAAIDAYQKRMSPEGMAKAEADARAALEKKYPGMFIPKKRTNTMIPGR
jgi:hypothetical protein